MAVNTTTACNGCGKQFDTEELSWCPTCDWRFCPNCDCPHTPTFHSDADKREYIELMAEGQRKIDAELTRIAVIAECC